MLDLDKSPTSLPWGGYNFDMPSRAVIAFGFGDRGAVLWTVGAHVNMEMQEHCIHDLEELGLEPPSVGIWIWEGTYSYFDEDAPEPRGEFRKPTDEEWQAIHEDRCPWNDLDWILPKHREEIAAERAERAAQKGT